MHDIKKNTLIKQTLAPSLAQKYKIKLTLKMYQLNYSYVAWPSWSGLIAKTAIVNAFSSQ